MTSDADQASARAMELSVVVPARNEEDVLGKCLRSLSAQNAPGFELGTQWELIVVNDGSTDGTRAIAEGFALEHLGIRVIEAPALEAKEFTGKNAACWVGAQSARGKWLLFTDSDTVHEPHDLLLSIREAERHEVQLLSYSPRQIVSGIWQRAVMPLVFSELASVYRMQEVNDPAKVIAAANGQFLLVQAADYFAVGGHRAVASEVLEDVALARIFKQSKRSIRFRYAPEALSTRMYRTTGQMIEGWSKNLAVLFPRPLYLAGWRLLDLALYVGLPVLVLGIPWLVTWQKGALLLIWVRTLWRYYARVARSNFPALDVALSIAGVPLFIYLLVRSTIQHRLLRRVTWKGRSYGTGR